MEANDGVPNGGDGQMGLELDELDEVNATKAVYGR